MSEVQTGTIKTKVPARLDRLPWSRWHWMIIIGLGTVWILDGLEVRRARTPPELAAALARTESTRSCWPSSCSRSVDV